MRKIFIPVLCLSSLLACSLLPGCGGGSDNNQGDSKDSTIVEKPKPIPADAVFLSGLYATSTNTPYSDFSPENLFDGTDKFWATMPGAGPDEGVMLYFDGIEAPASMEVKFMNDSTLENIKAIELYVNGAMVKILSPDSNVFSSFEGSLNSVFLRIKEAGKTQSKTVDVDGDGMEYTAVRYVSKKPVGINEIIFKDKAGKKLDVLPLKSLKGQLAASSILLPEEAYTPDFLFDSRTDFGWAEGNKEGSGLNETLTFKFDAPQNISKIKIWNGFQRSTEHFQKNARVKQFEFGTPGNMSSYSLADDMKPQVIALKQALSGKEFVLKITDIYKGASYTDLVISELMFYTDYGWSIINSGGVEQRKQTLVNKIKGSVLDGIVDHWFYDEMLNYGNWDNISMTSIILRSNQSFVIWTDSHTTSKNTEAVSNVYDGNWELVSATKDMAKIKIFGKRRFVSQGYGTYKGIQKQDRVSIFSDQLTITPSMIKGEKFIEQIHLK